MESFNVTVEVTGFNGEKETISATLEVSNANEYGVDWYIHPESIQCSDGNPVTLDDLEEVGGQYQYNIRQRLIIQAENTMMQEHGL